MNRLIYTILIYLSLPVAIFRILIKDSKDKSWKQKIKNQLGFVNAVKGKVIWIHCVSVGEFNAAKPLIDKMFNNFPSHKIVITTTTITGSKAVKNYYQNKVIHLFFPFDLPIVIFYFIKSINPVACILLETEIWPNLITMLKKKNIPVMLINARLSEKSLHNYRKFSSKLISPILKQLSIICSQNDYSTERFLSLNVEKKTIFTTGNLKFDINEAIDINTIQSIKKIIGNRKVIVFASTRDGEEKQIIQSYIKLQNKFNALLLIIPRHPERFDEVFDIVCDSGLNVERRSQNISSKDIDILIGDSMGEMMSYYRICDIAFIGGSLSNNGGQNMLEAASLSKPIIFGPSVYNFEEITNTLLANNSAIQVQDADELMQIILELLNDTERQKQLGENAKATFEKNKGSVDKVIELIAPFIKS